MEKGRSKARDSIDSIVFRWTTWGIESALTGTEALQKFKERAEFDYIVLFDDGSYEEDLKPGNALMGLKQAIFTVRRYIRFSFSQLRGISCSLIEM